MQLSLNTLSKRYADRTVLHGVSLQLDAGEIGCVLGPSGCGKTTLLRLIAGFDQPDTGAIRTGETILSSAETHVPARITPCCRIWMWPRTSRLACGI